WVFYGMTVAGVLVLRRKYPDIPRPYKMWGYPVTPIVFAGVAAWFVANTLISKPGPSSVGLLMILCGVPAYYGLRLRGTEKGAAENFCEPPFFGRNGVTRYCSALV